MKLKKGTTIGKKWEVLDEQPKQGFHSAVYKVRYKPIQEQSDINIPLEMNDEDWSENSEIQGALKILKIKDKLSPERKRIILREVSTLEALTRWSPVENIVKILDCGIEQIDGTDSPFYVEEFIDGKNFAHPSFKKNIKTSLNIGKQIANGLSTLHNRVINNKKKPIIHGDIKPENIMVSSKDNHAKLADFGSARRGTGEVFYKSSIRYCAPEIFDNKIYTSSDIYSLCASLYEVLTGQLPHRSSIENWKNLSKEQIIKQRKEMELKHKKEIPITPTQLNPEIPKSIEEILIAGLEKNHKNRPSIEEIYKALGGGKNQTLWWFHLNEYGENKKNSKTRFNNLTDIIFKDKILPVALNLKERLKDSTIKYPYRIWDNETRWNTVEAKGWCSGRWPGILWKAYEITQDKQYKCLAEEWMKNLNFNLKNPTISTITISDVTRSAFVPALRLTRKKEYKKFIDKSLEEIKKRYDSRGFIRTSSEKKDIERIWTTSSVLITPLLFEEGDEEAKEMALEHLYTLIKNNIREDNSVMECSEIGKHGEFIKEERKYWTTIENNALAKEYAHIITGVAIGFKSSKKTELLRDIKDPLDNILKEISENKLPNYDLRDKTRKIIDTNAAINLCYGLIELKNHHSIKKFRKKCHDHSINLLDSTIEKSLALEEEYEGILKNSYKTLEGGTEIKGSGIHTDYDFINCLTKIN